MIFYTKCPLCSASDIRFHIRCTDYLVTKEEFDLFRCQICGFVFTQGHPEQEKINSYYESEDYISHDDLAKGLVNRIYLVAREIMLRCKKKAVEKSSGISKGRLLDIGCGTGYFGGFMKKSGWHVSGIEPNEKAREFAIRRSGIEVIGPDRISELHDRTFDCITMWHVLEHLHNLYVYASEIRRLLRSDGSFISAVPNSDSYDAGFYRSDWAAYDVPRHLWHFNPSTFRLFWEQSGFSITGVKRLPLDVFYISSLSEKNLGSRLPFVRGVIAGSYFTIKTAFNMNKSSSLVFSLKKSNNQ